MPLSNIYSQNLPKISLTLSMWKKAKDFADRQANYQKAQQVYLNTLAVLSVNQYLQRSGIQTDLKNSNGYNLAMQTMLDNAELYLPEYGVISCRPTVLSDNFLIIPEETKTTAIMQLAVIISSDFCSAKLVGFIPQTERDRIPLEELTSIVQLPNFLEDYRSRAAVSYTQPEIASYNQQEEKSKLSGWLSGNNQEKWSKLTELVIQKLNLNLLDHSERSLAFRGSIVESVNTAEVMNRNDLFEGASKIKVWKLNQQGQDYTIAIIVNILPISKEEVDISIQFLPTGNHTHLPEGIIIKILNDQQETILQIQTTVNNDKIEFCLSGQPQETFTIQGVCDHQVKTETLII